jgi:hypothetical protein
MSKLKESLSDHDRGLLKTIEDHYNMVEGILGGDPLIYYQFSVMPPADNEEDEISSGLSQKRHEVFNEKAIHDNRSRTGS